MQLLSTTQLDQLASALIDELDTGVLVCAGQGTIVLANWAARQELNSGRWLRAPNCILEACDAVALGDALAAAVNRGRRRLLCLSNGGERLFVTISPLPSASAEDFALVLIGRRSPCSRLSLELLASSHGLTEAERKVLVGLARLTRPRGIAQEHGVELSTVRSQVSALHAKLGVNSQGETLSLIAGLPQLASALRVLAPIAHGRRLDADTNRQARAA